MNKNPFTEENGWSKLQEQKHDGVMITYVKHDNYRRHPSEAMPAVGWYITLEGKLYGDLLVLDNDKLQQKQTNSQAMKDAVILLQDQAERTIAKLKPKKENENNE